jgi:hypothetical protein
MAGIPFRPLPPAIALVGAARVGSVTAAWKKTFRRLLPRPQNLFVLVVDKQEIFLSPKATRYLPGTFKWAMNCSKISPWQMKKVLYSNCRNHRSHGNH